MKLHFHSVRFIPHGQTRLLGFGPSFQRHFGHVVHRGFYGPCVFRLILISHIGGTFSHARSHPFPGYYQGQALQHGHQKHH